MERGGSQRIQVFVFGIRILKGPALAAVFSGDSAANSIIIIIIIMMFFMWSTPCFGRRNCHFTPVICEVGKQRARAGTKNLSGRCRKRT